MATHSFASTSVLMTVSLVALVACRATYAPGIPSRPAPEDSLAGALVSGDQERDRQLRDEVLTGTRTIAFDTLTDERAVAPYTLLACTVDGRYWQLGVGRVSEYVLCLLQLVNRTSSDAILNAVAPALGAQCSYSTAPNSRGCEVCNSQAVPVSSDVKDALVGYWLSRDIPAYGLTSRHPVRR